MVDDFEEGLPENVTPFPVQELPAANPEQQKKLLFEGLREIYVLRFFKFVGDSDEQLPQRLREWKQVEKEELEVVFRKGRDVMGEEDLSQEGVAVRERVIDSLSFSDMKEYAERQVAMKNELISEATEYARRQVEMQADPEVVEDRSTIAAYETARDFWVTRLQNVERAIAEEKKTSQIENK